VFVRRRVVVDNRRRCKWLHIEVFEPLRVASNVDPFVVNGNQILFCRLVHLLEELQALVVRLFLPVNRVDGGKEGNRAGFFLEAADVEVLLGFDLAEVVLD